MLFDKLDAAKMHGLDMSNLSCRVETLRDVTSQVEFGLIPSLRTLTSHRISRSPVFWATNQLDDESNTFQI